MNNNKKTVSLADRKEALELLKQLYNTKEVKDDNQEVNTQRESGATRSCEMAKLPPNCS